MELLEKILNAKSDEKINVIINEAIKIADENSTKIDTLGFTDHIKINSLFKGFIPLNTRIRYENFAVETYGMQTIDYFFEFAKFIRRFQINSKPRLIFLLEYFINSYFGYPKDIKRSAIFNDIAWQTTTTDEEYFAAIENNKIGDLKGTGAAQCTERSALAQELLSIFGIETYYCMGCARFHDKEEGHCFNIVKRQNDYALLDYSVPVSIYDQDGNVIGYYPFVGLLTNEEFEEFVHNGLLKTFEDYKYLNKNQKTLTGDKRSYVVGSFTIDEEIKRG